jgi:hypothetical protein
MDREGRSQTIMRRNKLLKHRLVSSTIAALVAVVATSAIVLAVWTVIGSGTGSGAATVAQTLTITAVTPTGAMASLYPGGPAGSVYFKVANPNPFAVTITGLAWGTPVSTNTTACPNTNISLDPSAPTTMSISIPAGSTTGTVQISGVLDLAHSAPDGCQGVGFDIPVTVTATQQ